MDFHRLFISPLSVHIWAYVGKEKIPSKKLNEFLETFYFINFDKDILEKSLKGPTNDFEDNVQLHSALLVNCQIFLTLDKQLLKMAYFGQTEIKQNIQD